MRCFPAKITCVGTGFTLDCVVVVVHNYSTWWRYKTTLRFSETVFITPLTSQLVFFNNSAANTF